DIEVTPRARQLLIEKGFNQEYGARELKRTIHRMLTQPLAALVAEGHVTAGSRVVADLADSGDALTLGTEPLTLPPVESLPSRPGLVLDDNTQLLKWLRRELEAAGGTSVLAATAAEARTTAMDQSIDLAIVDLLLPDGDGISVAIELLLMWPRMRVVVMTG